MISVQEADRIILGTSLPPQIETIPYQQAVGRVLAEDIVADRDFPPFNRVSMDGIAIAYKSFESGQRKFQIEGIQAAGSQQLTLNDAANCIEVMTGAVAPKNTDTIIRYEDVKIEEGQALITIEDVRPSQNNHKQGTDRNAGDVIISKHTKISGAEMGVITSVGQTEVKVYTIPKIAIISTGEELVDVAETPLPHQIRKSNVHSVHAALNIHGLQANLFHLPDHREQIHEKLESIMANHEVLILSGGVSKGKYDYLPEAFDRLGVEKLFHKIQQRPGKPFWFGKKAQSNVIFAFPGNPVSTFMCLHRYFFPWIKQQQMTSTKKMTAVLTRDFSFKPPLHFFLQVQIESSNGQLNAVPVVGHGSGDLANLVAADGFLELPADRSNFQAGEVFPYISYRV